MPRPAESSNDEDLGVARQAPDLINEAQAKVSWSQLTEEEPMEEKLAKARSHVDLLNGVLGEKEIGAKIAQLSDDKAMRLMSEELNKAMKSKVDYFEQTVISASPKLELVSSAFQYFQKMIDEKHKENLEMINRFLRTLDMFEVDNEEFMAVIKDFAKDFAVKGKPTIGIPDDEVARKLKDMEELSRDVKDLIQREEPECFKSGKPYDPELTQCDLCGKTFVHENRVTLHNLFKCTATDATKHCDICACRFPPQHLEEHRKEHETEVNMEDPICCPVCLEVIPHRRDLPGHIKQEHPEVKKWICVHCSECFKAPSALAS